MEKQALKNQAEALQAELEFIQKRLAEVEAEGAAE
jgi:prefoldin subunit 5